MCVLVDTVAINPTGYVSGQFYPQCCYLRYHSMSVSDQRSSMNKSIGVTLCMQMVLLNKSIGVPVFESVTGWKNCGQTIWDRSVAMLLTASVFYFVDGSLRTTGHLIGTVYPLFTGINRSLVAWGYLPSTVSSSSDYYRSLWLWSRPLTEPRPGDHRAPVNFVLPRLSSRRISRASCSVSSSA